MENNQNPQFNQPTNPIPQGATKFCKHCRFVIPKDAKVCPKCKKKQEGPGKWYDKLKAMFSVKPAAPVAAPVPTPVVEPRREEPEFIFEQIKVAGVTFKSGRKSRQTILRKIKFRDDPYSDGLDLGLSYYEYEGNPAYNITVNDDVIGNVPADKVEYIDGLMDAGRIVGLTHIDVYGGGRNHDGTPMSYGAKITIKIKNS